MRRNTALANSARRVRALSERVEPEFRPDIAGEWAALLERIENRGDAAAIREIEEWTRWVEERLSATAAQAPLVARPHPCTQPPLPAGWERCGRACFPPGVGSQGSGPCSTRGRTDRGGNSA